MSLMLGAPWVGALSWEPIGAFSSSASDLSDSESINSFVTQDVNDSINSCNISMGISNDNKKNSSKEIAEKNGDNGQSNNVKM